MCRQAITKMNTEILVCLYKFNGRDSTGSAEVCTIECTALSVDNSM